jgi:C1A family cysteine protease
MLSRGRPENQEDRGSCVAFSATRMMERAYADHRGEDAQFSPEFVYAEGRAAINQLCTDSGMWPRQAMDTLHRRGVPTEAELPYKSRDICWRPGQAEYAAAERNRITEYARCMQPSGQALIDEVKAVLYGAGGKGHRVSIVLHLSVTFGQTGADGLMPDPDMAQRWGAHMMDVRGWDDTAWGGGFWVENQWWTTFGREGEIFVPYRIFLLPEEAGGAWRGDLWSLRVPVKVEPEPQPQPPQRKVYVQIWERPAEGDDFTIHAIERPVPLGGAWVTVKQQRGDEPEEEIVPFLRVEP